MVSCIRAFSTTTGNRRTRLRSLALLAIALFAINTAKAEDYFIYFATYTATVSRGIHAFLAISPDHRFLYAVNWKASGSEPGNTVSAFSIDNSTARLTFLNKVPSRGEMPTHLTIDARGQTLLVAN
jgi:6-phosphogluconolactonase